MKSGGPKILILTILLIGAAGLGWVIFGQFQKRAGSAKIGKVLRPVPVEVAQIQRGPIASQRTFSGELKALAEFVVAPKVSGRVERVIVNMTFANKSFNISVIDKGQGIPEPLPSDPNIERIIEDLDPPTGFGLFLIKRLVDKVEFNEKNIRGHGVRMVFNLY